MPLNEQQRNELIRQIERQVFQLPDFRRRRLRGRLRLGAADGLEVLGDQLLTDLGAFFEVGAAEVAAWPRPGLRLFVSHLAIRRVEFQALEAAFAASRSNFFLAHDDIEGGEAWRTAILRALDAMDALIVVHSPGFKESCWCNQEVGYALNRRVPILSIMHGEPPCGFLSDVQGFPWRQGQERDLAERMLKKLDEQDKIPARVGAAVARSLKHVLSYPDSDGVVARLDETRVINERALRDITLAVRFNDQVYESGAAEVHLPEIVGRHGWQLIVPEAIPPPP